VLGRGMPRRQRVLRASKAVVSTTHLKDTGGHGAEEYVGRGLLTAWERGREKRTPCYSCRIRDERAADLQVMAETLRGAVASGVLGIAYERLRFDLTIRARSG